MIFLLIPLYNEEDNIINLSEQIRRLPFSSDEFFIVFSDDGSSDDTQKLIRKFFKDFNFFVLEAIINQGPGAAFNNGFNYILQTSTSDEDIVITLEADSTSDFNLIRKMIVMSSMEFDIVLASVYAQGGGFQGTTVFRKAISSIANLLFRYVFDIKVLTLSSFFRLYKVSILKNIKEKHQEVISEKGFICMLEVLLKAIRIDAKIIEIPMVLHSNNRVGKSKMKIVKTTKEYLSFFWRNWRKMK
jgi:dolichol-phosphate mannosyltransferase